MKYGDDEIGGKHIDHANMRFSGDEAKAREYIPIARNILGQLKRGMEFNKLDQNRRQIKLQDGTIIGVSSVKGTADTDQIFIYHPPVSEQKKPESDYVIGFIVHMTGTFARVNGPEHTATNNDYISVTANSIREMALEEDTVHPGEFDGTFEYDNLALNYAENTYLLFYGIEDDFFTQTHSMPRHPDAEGDFFPPPQSTDPWDRFAPYVGEIQAAFEDKWTEANQGALDQIALSYENASIQTIPISPTRTERSGNNYISIHGVSPVFDGFKSILFNRSTTEGVITAVPFEIDFSFSDQWSDLYSFQNIYDTDFGAVLLSNYIINDPTYGAMHYYGTVGEYDEGGIFIYDPVLLHTDEGTDLTYDGFPGKSKMAHGDYKVLGEGTIIIYLFTMNGLVHKKTYSMSSGDEVKISVGRPFQVIEEVVV